MKYRIWLGAMVVFLVFGGVIAQANSSWSKEFCMRENGTFSMIRESRQRMDCKRNGFIFYLGNTSTSGSVGPDGPAGATGATGPIGATGATGPDGQRGATGATGPKGDPGETGATGPMGPQGDQGEKGESGPKGEPGDRGEIGPMGPSGADGASGITGYEIILGEVSTDDELQKTVTASCPTGKVVIGGGYLTLNVSNSSEVVITRNYPSTRETWEVKGGVDGSTAADESFSLQAYAICIISREA